MLTTRAPAVIPAGWDQFQIDCVIGLRTVTVTGLTATFSIDPLAPVEELSDDSEWRHMVISRPDRYPGWDEMRDFVYESGLFDRHKSIMMVLPPKARPEQYVNDHKNAFHWFQEV